MTVRTVRHPAAPMLLGMAVRLWPIREMVAFGRTPDGRSWHAETDMIVGQPEQQQQEASNSSSS